MSYNKSKIKVESTAKKTNPWLDDIPYTPNGLYEYPDQVVNVPTVDGSITTAWLDRPVYGVSNAGEEKMMYPNQNYQFQGNMVREYPMKGGGQIYDLLGRLHSIKSYVPFAQEGGQPELTPEQQTLYTTYKNRIKNPNTATRAEERLFELQKARDKGEFHLLSDHIRKQAELELRALEEGSREKTSTPEQKFGGWLDQYQGAGEYKWDPSQMQTQPQVTLPTVGTYSRSAQNTAFDNPYRKLGVVEQAIEEDREMAHRALPMNVRGEAPAEYVPIEMAFMPATLPVRGASLLGRAGKFAAETLNPLAGMRNIGSKLAGKKFITEALEPGEKKLLHDLRVAGSIYDSDAPMLDKLKSIVKLNIDDTSLKKLIGKTKQELKTHIDELTEQYVTKKQPYKLDVDSDIEGIGISAVRNNFSSPANIATNLHEATRGWLAGARALTGNQRNRLRQIYDNIQTADSPTPLDPLLYEDLLRRFRNEVNWSFPTQKRFLNNSFRNRLGLAKSNMQYIQDAYKYQDYEPLIHAIAKKTDPNPAGTILKATKRVLNSPKGSKFYPSASLSTDSNNAALGLIENLVKKDKVEAKFMQYKPLNFSGYLSKAGISPELILQEMNNKIADINRLGKGNKIPYGYIKKGQVMYPDIGVIRKLFGGATSGWLDQYPDGTAHGKALTDKQKRYFGWIAGGRKQYGGLPTASSYGVTPRDQGISDMEEYARRQAIAAGAQESAHRGIPLESAGMFDPIDWVTGAAAARALIGSKAAIGALSKTPKSLPAKGLPKGTNIPDPDFAKFKHKFGKYKKEGLSPEQKQMMKEVDNMMTEEKRAAGNAMGTVDDIKAGFPDDPYLSLQNPQVNSFDLSWDPGIKRTGWTNISNLPAYDPVHWWRNLLQYGSRPLEKKVPIMTKNTSNILGSSKRDVIPYEDFSPIGVNQAYAQPGQGLSENMRKLLYEGMHRDMPIPYRGEFNKLHPNKYGGSNWLDEYQDAGEFRPFRNQQDIDDYFEIQKVVSKVPQDYVPQELLVQGVFPFRPTRQGIVAPVSQAPVSQPPIPKYEYQWASATSSPVASLQQNPVKEVKEVEEEPTTLEKVSLYLKSDVPVKETASILAKSKGIDLTEDEVVESPAFNINDRVKKGRSFKNLDMGTYSENQIDMSDGIIVKYQPRNEKASKRTDIENAIGITDYLYDQDFTDNYKHQHAQNSLNRLYDQFTKKDFKDRKFVTVREPVGDDKYKVRVKKVEDLEEDDFKEDRIYRQGYAKLSDLDITSDGKKIKLKRYKDSFVNQGMPFRNPENHENQLRLPGGKGNYGKYQDINSLDQFGPFLGATVTVISEDGKIVKKVSGSVKNVIGTALVIKKETGGKEVYFLQSDAGSMNIKADAKDGRISKDQMKIARNQEPWAGASEIMLNESPYPIKPKESIKKPVEKSVRKFEQGYKVGKHTVSSPQVKKWLDNQPQNIKEQIENLPPISYKRLGGWLDDYNS